ncbi:hypothetical protein D3C75_943650 [compost metagenome]
MDGSEHGVVHLGFHAHRLEGQEHLAVNVPQAAEQRRDAHEVDVFRQLLGPRLDGRLELVAVRATVPEQLDHLDLAGLGHRYRAAQFDVLLAGLDVLGLSGGAEQAETGQHGRENQVTHA